MKILEILSNYDISLKKNPSKNVLNAMFDKYSELRALWSNNNTFYVWNSYAATHHDIKNMTGENGTEIILNKNETKILLYEEFLEYYLKDRFSENNPDLEDHEYEYKYDPTEDDYNYIKDHLMGYIEEFKQTYFSKICSSNINIEISSKLGDPYTINYSI